MSISKSRKGFASALAFASAFGGMGGYGGSAPARLSRPDWVVAELKTEAQNKRDRKNARRAAECRVTATNQ